MLCWCLGSGFKKLAAASISCLLGCSLLEPSHHTMRVYKLSLHRLTKRGTEVSEPELSLSSQPTASNNLPVVWGSHLESAFSCLSQGYVEQTNSPCQAPPKLQIHEKNECRYVFKLLSFVMAGYAAIENWHLNKEWLVKTASENSLTWYHTSQ